MALLQQVARLSFFTVSRISTAFFCRKVGSEQFFGCDHEYSVHHCTSKLWSIDRRLYLFLLGCRLYWRIMSIYWVFGQYQLLKLLKHLSKIKHHLHYRSLFPRSLTFTFLRIVVLICYHWICWCFCRKTVKQFVCKIRAFFPIGFQWSKVSEVKHFNLVNTIDL